MCVLIGIHIGGFFVLVCRLQRVVIVYEAQPVWLGGIICLLWEA